MNLSYANETLSQSCTDLLEKFGEKVPGQFRTYWFCGWTFSRTGLMDLDGQPDWEVCEQVRPTNVVELNDSQASRVVYALSVGADSDVVAESLNLR